MCVTSPTFQPALVGLSLLVRCHVLVNEHVLVNVAVAGVTESAGTRKQVAYSQLELEDDEKAARFVARWCGRTETFRANDAAIKVIVQHIIADIAKHSSIRATRIGPFGQA